MTGLWPAIASPSSSSRAVVNSAGSRPVSEPAEVERDSVVPDAGAVVQGLDGFDQHGQLGLLVEHRQVGQGVPANLFTGPVAEQQLEVDPSRSLHLEEFIDAQPAEEEPGAGVAGDGDGLARCNAFRQ